ncbi:type II toxin-antitoxin system VapB family antitoxin [Mesorhizobium sp. BAC0120]|uniref:type II toxin-antitoxin system VapB family antitoxin n=1 Tax=Mesorhizobium sp. BAC0120 TaxID=3090670 RepID=UPI00298CEF3E|nr:type II toxin-antitoxin system VapB family antitoxin [Mesorhizobium sp. BAC0120]MDW6021973.1 type II toxin-antitoxin system VapB family antitoxin [Mesorhizobium sp. BAC0120]
MRTNIEIDDTLLQEAMKFSGQKTKKGVVEEALRKYVRLARQKEALEAIQGMGWEGDLDKMREGRFFDDIK